MLSRVYSGKGEIIAEYAKERRIFVPIDEVPDIVKQAFISAEDKNFYSHPGIDATGILKAFAPLCTGQDPAAVRVRLVRRLYHHTAGDEELPGRQRARHSSERSKKAILAVRVGKVL